jgi:putative transposase
MEGGLVELQIFFLLSPCSCTGYNADLGARPGSAKQSKYSEEQIIGFLRQAEAGMPIKEIGRKHGFSDASFCKWRAQCGGKQLVDPPGLNAET